jgi:threonine aldolase
MIDLRSDTVTKPTPEMRKAMSEAAVGDDVFGEDITIKQLESTVAKMFQKDAALFFPSGTMSNLTALLTWCPLRGSEFIVGDKNHIFLYEQAGASQFGGISSRTVPSLLDGTMDLNQLKLAIRDNDIHEPSTKLICIENTHNACGGKILPISFQKNLKILADFHNIPIHLDGARLWNAITALGCKPQDLGVYADSISVCLSKGLGAPIGSLLIGPEEFIKTARRIRKALGGGMRQVGILGAAGLQALEDFNNDILIFDHYHTQQLVTSFKSLYSFKLRNVQTNIIFMDIILYDKTWHPKLVSTNVSNLLKEKGVLVSVWEPLLIRIVLHRDITFKDVEKTIQTFKEVDAYLSTI